MIPKTIKYYGKKGLSDLVLAKSLSRFGRDTVEILTQETNEC